MERVQARGLAKRVVACACSAALAVSMVPAVAFADVADTDGASIGDTGYATIQAAIDAAQAGDTVKMLRDAEGIQSTDGVKITDKEITLDLNGHDIPAFHAMAWAMTITNSTLTIIDSSAVAGGAMGTIDKPTPSGWMQQGYTIQMANSTLEVKQGRFTNHYSRQVIAPKQSGAGENTVIIGEAGTDDSLVQISSSSDSGYGGGVYGSKVVVNSGTIETKYGVGSAGDLTINGGVIKADGNPCVSASTTTINGGTLVTTADACISSGDVTVNDGYLTCKSGSNPIATTGSVTLNGGHFSEPPVADLTADNVACAEGMTVGFADGWYVIGEFTGPSVTNVSLPDAYVGYATRVQLSSYPQAASYEVKGKDGAELPSWVTVDEEKGRISGTPDAVGTVDVEITAIAEDGTKGATKSFTWTIGEVQAPVVTTESLPDGCAGEEYNVQLEATGNPAEFTWRAEDLPAGLTLSEDGVISGSPMVPGVNTFTVYAANFATEGEGKSLTIKVYTTKIGDVKYMTPGEAIEAAEDGATVEILGPTKTSLQIPAGKNITLQLDGELKAEGGKSAIVNNGTLTLAGSGPVTSSEDVPAVLTNAGGKTSIGVDVTTTKGAGVQSLGETVLTKGTISATGEGASAVVVGHANKADNAAGTKATFEMSTGTVKGQKYGAEVLAWGEFVMKGGKLSTSDTAAGVPLFVDGSALITGGTVGDTPRVAAGAVAVMLGDDAGYDEAACPQAVQIGANGSRVDLFGMFPQWFDCKGTEAKSKGSIDVAYTRLGKMGVNSDGKVLMSEAVEPVVHFWKVPTLTNNNVYIVQADVPTVVVDSKDIMLTRDVSMEAIELSATQTNNAQDAEGNYYAGAAVFAVAEGSALPAGLELSDDGKISGTPTEKGEFKTSVVASNKFGTSAPVELTFTVEADPAMTAAAAEEAVKTAQDAAGEAAAAQEAVAAAEGMAAKAEAAQAAVEKLASAQEAAETAKSVAADAVEAAQAAADKAQAALEEAQAADPADEEAVAAAQAKLDAAKTALEAVKELDETASGLKAEAAEKAPVASALAGAYKEAAASEEALKAANEEAAAAAKAESDAAAAKAAADLEAAKAASDAAAKKAETAETALAAANEKVASLERAAAAASQAAAAGKKDNPMTVKAKKVKAKAKKKTKISAKKAFAVSGAAGKVTFAKLSGNAKVTVKANGKVVVAKGLKKGKTVKVKVLVVDSGNASYAPAVKTVTLKIKVK